MRHSGVLMHISSLSGPYGIGTLGPEARSFAGFLREAGQSLWQILPTGPTGYGDSPYTSFSAFAGNPFFIDPGVLAEEGFLTREEVSGIDFGPESGLVDYDRVKESREKLFSCLFRHFRERQPEDYEEFCRRGGYWLEDYALYEAVREAQESRALQEWDDDIRMRDPQAVERYRRECADRVEYHRMLQYFFFRQWEAFHRDVRAQGIRLIGDIPIYPAADSADVWASPEEFQLDAGRNPVECAGCSPDAFTADGQLWGNPIYDFDHMKENDYAWWTNRIAHMLQMVDIVRIDHFRAFDSYYGIPAGETTARNGSWHDGPGVDFFRRLEEKLGPLPVIAEDLGDLTDRVRQMVEDTGYPGMKILQFAFAPWDRSSYLPYRLDRNCVIYSGTHDNNTTLGWYEENGEEIRSFFRAYTGMNDGDSPVWPMIRTVLASVADTAVLAAQDLLELDGSGRMNRPSTVGGNWAWRALPGVFTQDLADRLRNLTDTFGRYNMYPPEG